MGQTGLERLADGRLEGLLETYKHLRQPGFKRTENALQAAEGRLGFTYFPGERTLESKYSFHKYGKVCDRESGAKPRKEEESRLELTFVALPTYVTVSMEVSTKGVKSSDSGVLLAFQSNCVNTTLNQPSHSHFGQYTISYLMPSGSLKKRA